MDAKPESEPKSQPETTEEKEVCNFEEGVEQITEKMKSLLNEQDYVVLSIAGPLSNDTDVGKTALSRELISTCIQENIPYVSTTNTSSLSFIGKPEKINDGVIIFGGMMSPSDNNISEEEIALMKINQDLLVKNTANLIGMPISKIDLRVFIYRAGRPILKGDRMFNDILINNQHAIDDPSKLQNKK